MKCVRCMELKKRWYFHQVRMVPLTGRAAQNELCCKCDRAVNGPQSEEDKGEKQKQIELRRQAYRDTYIK